MGNRLSTDESGAAPTEGPLPHLLPPEDWSGRSVQERARALESVCATAMQIIASSPDGPARLAHLDPVPGSTLRIIRELIAKEHGRAPPSDGG